MMEQLAAIFPPRAVISLHVLILAHRGQENISPKKHSPKWRPKSHGITIDTRGTGPKNPRE